MDKQSSGGKKGKQRRRKKHEVERDAKKKPIRLVSSLGEGKLIDRFQNAIGEKETKRKLHEKGEKERRASKEKREREMAKFKAELNALLEDETDKPSKQKENKSFVPKLQGTVKGKFEAIEKQKAEEEQNRIKMERQRRMTRDLMEKKRIQIEIVEKRQKGLLLDEGNFPDSDPKPVKKMGKIKSNFEDMNKQRKAKEQRNIELKKQAQLSSELRAVREYYAQQQREENEEEKEEEDGKKFNSSSERNTPKKLKSNFDELLREREEQQRQAAEDRRQQQLEEETRQFRAAKLAARLSQSLESNNGSSSASQADSNEKISCKPNRLNSSLTKFDILEKERAEEERKRIRERRKALLEEERKLFEESRRELEEQEDQEDAIEKSYPADDKENATKKPGSLSNYFKKFDMFARQKLEDERKRIQTERAELLEEEKKYFQDQKNTVDSESEKEENHDEDLILREKRIPNKLAQLQLSFDVLERERIEKERIQIQKRRQQLLQEEKDLFASAREQHLEEEDEEESYSNVVNCDGDPTRPGRLDCNFRNFALLTMKKLDEEKERIKNERNQLLKEERKLMEEEKMKLLELEENEKNIENKKTSSVKNSRKPQRLSKSFTKFDELERQRVKQEEERLYKEKALKLEEEKLAFQKAKNISDDEDDVTSGTKELLKLSKGGPRPKKLSSSFTQFDVLERRRREEERERLQKKKAKELAEEREMFERSKEEQFLSDDESTAGSHETAGQSLVKKIDIRAKMAAVLKAQEEVERKRIEETKFTRMTVEQQEIFLAKQRQIEYLKEQLARAEAESSSCDDDYDDDDYSDDDDSRSDGSDNDDDEEDKDEDEDEDEDEDASSEDEDESSYEEDEDIEETSMCSGSTHSNSSGGYSGAPYFVQTLKNLTVTEGDPVRFDANINANPHPKVTWFFKNRQIRNSPDYQYICKGTLYSLYMNESFLDDVGEYMCKAVNDKGSATSIAYLVVKDSE